MQILASKPLDFYKKAISCSQHYGFIPIDDLTEVHTPDERLLRSTKERPTGALLEQKHRKIDGVSREFEQAVKYIGSRNLTGHTRPMLFYTTNVSCDDIKNGEPLPKTMTFGLHAVGMRQSIAEALVLKTALTILDDLGETQTYVQLNSIGDRDSSAKFLREATAHMRKQLNDLPPQAREAFKEDLFLGYNYLCKKKHELAEELPRPMEFLTSASRKHFREVLEFLEAADVPYIFDDRLMGHRDCYTQTLFSIRKTEDDPFADETDEQPSYARGGRYDELARKYFRLPTPAVGIVFSFKPEVPKPQTIKVTLPKSNRKPQVYFIQLGYAAQLKSLTIVEALRRARVSIEQSLDTQRLSDQLAYAESLSIPYTVIMGQKEALEGNVIVRDTMSRSQQTVAVEMLPLFFKEAKS